MNLSRPNHHWYTLPYLPRSACSYLPIYQNQCVSHLPIQTHPYNIQPRLPPLVYFSKGQYHRYPIFNSLVVFHVSLSSSYRFVVDRVLTSPPSCQLVFPSVALFSAWGCVLFHAPSFFYLSSSPSVYLRNSAVPLQSSSPSSQVLPGSIVELCLNFRIVSRKSYLRGFQLG